MARTKQTTRKLTPKQIEERCLERKSKTECDEEKSCAWRKRPGDTDEGCHKENEDIYLEEVPEYTKNSKDKKSQSQRQRQQQGSRKSQTQNQSQRSQAQQQQRQRQQQQQQSSQKGQARGSRSRSIHENKSVLFEPAAYEPTKIPLINDNDAEPTIYIPQNKNEAADFFTQRIIGIETDCGSAKKKTECQNKISCDWRRRQDDQQAGCHYISKDIRRSGDDKRWRISKRTDFTARQTAKKKQQSVMKKMSQKPNASQGHRKQNNGQNDIKNAVIRAEKLCFGVKDREQCGPHLKKNCNWRMRQNDQKEGCHFKLRDVVKDASKQSGWSIGPATKKAAASRKQARNEAPRVSQQQQREQNRRKKIDEAIQKERSCFRSRSKNECDQKESCGWRRRPEDGESGCHFENFDVYPDKFVPGNYDDLNGSIVSRTNKLPYSSRKTTTAKVTTRRSSSDEEVMPEWFASKAGREYGRRYVTNICRVNQRTCGELAWIPYCKWQPSQNRCAVRPEISRHFKQQSFDGSSNQQQQRRKTARRTRRVSPSSPSVDCGGIEREQTCRLTAGCHWGRTYNKNSNTYSSPRCRKQTSKDLANLARNKRNNFAEIPSEYRDQVIRRRDLLKEARARNISSARSGNRKTKYLYGQAANQKDIECSAVFNDPEACNADEYCYWGVRAGRGKNPVCGVKKPHHGRQRPSRKSSSSS